MGNLKILIRESVPSSVQLLFDNTKLDIVKTLLLLYTFSLQSKTKYKKVSEIVFYYSLVNFDLIKLFDSEGNSDKLSINLYFRFQLKINQIVLQLSQLAFIDVKGNLGVKTGDIGIRLSSTGLSFVEKLDSDYFTNLVNEYKNVLSTIEYSTANLKILKGGAVESYEIQ